MCGRYRLTAKERYLRDHFGLDEDLSWAPRWNIAPTQPVPIIRQHPKEPKRTFGLFRWGLIPYWAKDPSIGFKTIKAMSETAAEKPAFREAIGGDAASFTRTVFTADAVLLWCISLGKIPYFHFPKSLRGLGQARHQALPG